MTLPAETEADDCRLQIHTALQLGSSLCMLSIHKTLQADVMALMALHLRMNMFMDGGYEARAIGHITKTIGGFGCICMRKTSRHQLTVLDEVTISSTTTACRHTSGKRSSMQSPAGGSGMPYKPLLVTNLSIRTLKEHKDVCCARMQVKCCEQGHNMLHGH